jgi:pectate lyase
MIKVLRLIELKIIQVMLLGHSDSYVRDKQMQVTIAYNHFGEGLIQRMPR